MSTRYVWGKYTIDDYERLERKTAGAIDIDGNGVDSYYGIHLSTTNGGGNIYYTTTTSEETIQDWLKSGISRFNNMISVGDSIQFPAKTYIAFNSRYSGSSARGNIVVHYTRSSSTIRFEAEVPIWKAYPTSRIPTYEYYMESGKEAGTLLGSVSGPSQSSYPSDGMQGSYWYTYLGSDNIDPTAVSYDKMAPKGGESITIKVTARSNTYGGRIKYQYQVQLDSGSWTTLTTTTSTSYSYTVPKGTNTFRARVRASDNYGFTSSTYVTGSTLNVINNTAPTISGSNSNLGSFAYIPPYIEYVINDVDGNTVSVSIQLDSQSIYRGTAVLGKTRFIIFPDWDSLLNGSHTITITANDGQGGTATRTYTFSKSVNANLISRERWRRLNEGNVYDVIYFETAADVVTTNNGKYLRDRINAIRSRIAALKGTSATALAAMDSSIITERLHMKTDSGYNVKYLDTKSQYVKIGSQTVEDVLTQIESDIAALKG